MPGAPYPSDLLTDLESFASLLRCVRRHARGAFENTARELHVDRSVLRRRMHTLGAWLGTPLLDGRGSRLRPTAAGTRLGEQAERMLRLARELPDYVGDAKEPFIIACTGAIAMDLLPPALLAWEKRKKGIKPIIRRAGGSACERLVRSGDVDLGVVRAGEPPRGLSSHSLGPDRLWLVSRRSGKTRLSLEEMSRLPLVLYSEASRTRARVMERLGPLGAVIRIEVDGKAAAIEYTRQGFGATFLSLLPNQRVRAPGLATQDVTPLFPPSHFYLIHHPSRASDPTLGAVVRDLVRRARALK
jgi:DNA-binding transcriptional LysR family regulator